MLKLVVRRMMFVFPLFVFVTSIVFLLLHLAPGDPAVIAAGGAEAQLADIEAVRDRLGLNDPFLVQYGRWFSDVVRGNLGESLFSSLDVAEALLSRLPITLSVSVGAIIMAVLIAFPAGILAALKSGSWIDRVTLLGSSAGIAAPNFFVGLMLVLVVSRWLGWLPATGYQALAEGFRPWLSHLILPSLALGGAFAAELARHVRASLLDVLDQDYVRTAWAKGLPGRVVVLKHALRNALLPVVTVLGVQARQVLGGSIVIEQVFALPGVGALLIRSVLQRDFPMIQGVMILTVVVVILANLLVDISYGYVNPRVRDS